MKTSAFSRCLRSARSGFITAKFALVLAGIIGGAALLTYEWHQIRPPMKQHHQGVSEPHHHHKHDGTTPATSS